VRNYMHIVVVNGSPRKSGRTGIAARHIAQQYGAQLIDLSEGTIPLYNDEASQEALPAVRQLREQIRASPYLQHVEKTMRQF
jgi:azobenzene reductase